MDGILIVDKEKGWTSHDVCAFIKSRFGIPKVGHGGTLDPLATGVLVILLGRATRMFNTVSSSEKEYLGTMLLGVETDSHDQDGRVVAEKAWDFVTKEKVEETFKKFRGEIMQKPPMISALKHKGVRLYQLARQGKEVEREARPVMVKQLESKTFRLPEIDFVTTVSRGTYVRTLVHDIGETLGTCAILKELRRTRSGDFKIEDSIKIAALKQMDQHTLVRHVRMSAMALVAS